MRLIDADALRDKLQNEIDKGIPPHDDIMGAIRCGVRLARNIVEDEPTIDAEPVIRCRDCKFLRLTGTVWKCQNRLVMMLCEPNDYCSRAERRVSHGTDSANHCEMG